MLCVRSSAQARLGSAKDKGQGEDLTLDSEVCAAQAVVPTGRDRWTAPALGEVGFALHTQFSSTLNFLDARSQLWRRCLTGEGTEHACALPGGQMKSHGSAHPLGPHHVQRMLTKPFAFGRRENGIPTTAPAQWGSQSRVAWDHWLALKEGLKPQRSVTSLAPSFPPTHSAFFHQGLSHSPDPRDQYMHAL